MSPTASDPFQGVKFPITVPVVLDRYVHETISREEALRRLEGRPLDAKARSEIVARIPDETQHYMTFHGGAFREYADFGDEGSYLLLLLPVEARGDKFIVSVPIYGVDPRGEHPAHALFGVEQHEYSVSDGRLVENGETRDSFRYVEGQPVELRVHVTFLFPDHPSNGCCGACEWVHSALHIHCADRICCIGMC